MTAAELKKHVEIAGWENVAADLTVASGFAIRSKPKWREQADAHYPKPC